MTPPGKDGSARAAKVAAWTRPSVRALKPYYKAPLDGDPLRLDQNTNLHGPNPCLADLDPTAVDVAQYPTRDADALLDDLAAHHSVAPENLVLGNGSDEILDLITKAYTLPGGTLAAPTPSYSLYPFYAHLQDLKLKQVPLRGGFRLDVDGLLAAEADLTIVASPNNPTGNRFPTGDLERLVLESDGVVVVDEAYIEYAGEPHSFLRRVEDYDNLIVTRTFSKAFGLAGLRIGYAAANQDLMQRLRLVKPPFNLNLLSEAAGRLALQHKDWMEATVAAVVEERERMADALRRHGFRIHPSDANFLLADAPDDPGIVQDALKRQGILVRTFPGGAGLDRCVRFTVGRPEHTDALDAALAEVLA